MKKVLLFFCAFLTQQLFAQFTTPTVNGAIGASEYGTHTDGNNQQTNFYVTWDAINLYVGIINANVSEGAVLYLDKAPTAIVNGGANSDGTIVGFNNYDNTSFSNLPFRADLVVYFTNTYREYRTSNGSGGWSSQTAGFGSYADAGGSTREIAIPWSVIGGIPASFNSLINHPTTPFIKCVTILSKN